MRRVLDCESRNGTLKLMVQRFGQAKPTKIEICRGRDHRSPSARKAARAAYETLLRRILEREHPGATIEPLRSTADLERSFSPVYARGVVRSGRSAFAVLGVNSQEPQAAIDGALTFGILWLDYCRQHLSAFKCPRTVDFAAELPRHPTGKLYKRLLRDPYWEGRSAKI